MKEMLKKIADKYGLGINKKELVSKIYWEIVAQDIKCDMAILNDIYLDIDKVNYQFIKSKKNNEWIVKEF